LHLSGYTSYGAKVFLLRSRERRGVCYEVKIFVFDGKSLTVYGMRVIDLEDGIKNRVNIPKGIEVVL